MKKNNSNIKKLSTSTPNSFIGFMIDNAREAKNYWSTFCSIDIDMENVNALRVKMCQQGRRITFTAFIANAISKAVRDHMLDVPELNAAIVYRPWTKIVYFNQVDLGIAAETTVDKKNIFHGPIIRDADKKSLQEIAEELEEISKAAENNPELLEKDLSIINLPWPLRKLAMWIGSNVPRFLKKYRGTIFLTGVGQYGVNLFLLANRNLEFSMGSIESRAVVRNNIIVSRKTMTLTAIFDHRTLHAGPVARLLVQIRENLERDLEGLLGDIKSENLKLDTHNQK